MQGALYTQSIICNPESLDDLRHHGASGVKEVQALVTSKDQLYQPGVRDAKLLEISHLMYPDICSDLVSLLDMHNNVISWYYEIREFNYLKYEIGGHFKRHHDWVGSNNNDIYSNRHFTTITLLKKSDDMEGGDLLIWRHPETDPDRIELDVNESVIFDARLLHQVTPLTKGTREVLVAWVYLKSPDQTNVPDDPNNPLIEKYAV